MKTMHRLSLVCVISALAFTGVVIAWEDIPIPFKKIEYTLNDSNSVIVEVEDALPRTLQRITIVWDGQTSNVPQNVLSEMMFADVSSIKIETGTHFKGGNEGTLRRLSITVADPRPDSNLVLNPDSKLRVHFSFWDKKLQQINLWILDGSELPDPFVTDTAIWNAEKGYSWQGKKYDSLSDILNAIQDGQEKKKIEVVDPFAGNSMETEKDADVE